MLIRLIPLARLLGGRADASAVKKRLLGAGDGGAHERELAERLLALKREMAGATGQVRACSTCAEGQAWPRGAYAGGDCCSGLADNVFSDDEIAALALTGTRARDLVEPPRDDAQAGCVFRGAHGCSLAVDHRPSVCVRYACTKLQRELSRLGRLDSTEQIARELGEVLAAFATARAAREAAEWADRELAAIERSLR